MVVSYCCGFVAGTNKHQLWCSQHPDRKKKADTMKEQTAPKPPSNSEQAEIDDVAKSIAASLDADDRWEVRWNSDWGDQCWSPDGKLRFGVAAVNNIYAPRPDKITLHLQGAGRMYTANSEATASQDHIWEAYKRWQHRRYLAHLNPPPPPPPSPPIPREPSWLERLLTWTRSEDGDA